MGPLALVAARPEVSIAGPIESGAATFTACVSLGVHARVLCASVHASGWPGSRVVPMPMQLTLLKGMII